MSDDSNYTKGFVLGALIGGFAGAITALLLAPKSGKELRQDIALKSSEFYEKASDYISSAEQSIGNVVQNTVNEGKIRAQNIVNSARRQAEDLLSSAENVLSEAKTKASTAKDSIQNKIENIRDAAKASADAFRTELKHSSED